MGLEAYVRISLARESALHGLGEIGEELVGQFLGRAVDQALAELGELAADLGLDIIAQERAAILVGQLDRGQETERRATLLSTSLQYPPNRDLSDVLTPSGPGPATRAAVSSLGCIPQARSI